MITAKTQRRKEDLVTVADTGPDPGRREGGDLFRFGREGSEWPGPRLWICRMLLDRYAERGSRIKATLKKARLFTLRRPATTNPQTAEQSP